MPIQFSTSCTSVSIRYFENLKFKTFSSIFLGFAIYSLVSVYGNFKGLKYCPTKEVQMELGGGNS